MVVSALRTGAPGVPFRVLTADPEGTARRLVALGLLTAPEAHEAVAARGPLQALGEVARAGLLVSGGGGLLQEGTSRRSLLYYVGLLLWARLLGVPRTVFAQGVGPLWRPASRWLTRLALAGAPLSVRDEPSRRLLEGLGLSPVHLTADPVFAAPLPSPERLGAQGPLAVILRPHPKPGGFERDVGLLAAIAEEARSRQVPVHLLPFQPGPERDWAARLAQAVPPVRLVQLPEGTGLQAWLAQFRAYRAVVSARYHGLAFGALAGKPLLALAVDPKLVALTHELGLEGGSLEPPFDPVQVRQAVARLLDEGRPPRPEAVAHLRTRAQEGLEGLVRLARALAEPATAAPRLSWRDRRFPVLGLPIDPVSLDEAVAIISEWCEGEGPARQVITSNPELVMHAQTPGEESARLREVMARADLIVADGVGLVWAARFLGYALPGRVAGADLAERLCEEAARRGWRLFLWGGEPGVAYEAAQRLRARWPGLQVVGTVHGYLRGAEEAEALERLRQARPDLLLVGLGAPRQELWIDGLRRGEELASRAGRPAPGREWGPARVMMGVGGVLDVWAGRKRRAPRWVQALGLEWAYRVLQEPARVRRLAALPRFVAAVVAERLAVRGNGG